MNALNKVKQAKYHLKLMKATDPSTDEFLFNLVSFISSGREVTWYLQKEFNGSANFRHWYAAKQQQMKANETFEFFRNKRNVVVKETLPGLKGYTGYVKFYYINGEGKVARGECWAHPSHQPADFLVPGGVLTIAPDQVTAKTSLNAVLQGVEYTSEYFFEEKLDKRVIPLCEEYLLGLEKLCEEWAIQRKEDDR